MSEPQVLSSYSDLELEAIVSHSPAFAHYWRILQNAKVQTASPLHHQRLTAWCQCVAATFSKNLDASLVCRYWSKVSDNILIQSWKDFELDQEDLSLFALGKLGGEELNLSSDVDLLVVSNHPANIETESKVKKWVRYLSQSTEFGFLFRVDMDLRPGGRFAGLIPSKSQVLDHYWGRGETWERLAMIRLRPLCGAQNVIDGLLELRKAFSFRKYLDYSVLEDLRILRQSLFNFKDHTPNKTNIKLEPGAIRDIELLVHAMQVLHGGRLTDLQVGSFNQALQLLKDHEFISDSEYNTILNSYWTLRQIENEIQGKDDRQTYLVSKDLPLPDLDSTQKIINEKIGEPLSIKKLPDSFDGQMQWLSEYGYEPGRIQESWKKILESLSFSRSSTQFRAYKDAVVYDFIVKLSQGLNPYLGLGFFADFIHASRAKASLFTVLAQSPNLINDLARLFTSSSYASQIVTSRPELIDSLFLQQTAFGGDDLQERLENLLDKKFITQVSVGLNFLKGENVIQVTQDLSTLADQIIDELTQEINKDHPSELSLLKLGKWGRCETSFKSDLDFILVAHDSITEADIKFSRRLISRLTEAHRGGSLYGMDLRLRPNGAAGPLVVTADHLIEFMKDKADAWQRQSYFMIRSQSTDLTDQLRNVIFDRGLSQSELKELLQIRQMLWNKAGPLDLKYSKGGLVDIEFACQLALIDSGNSANSTPEALKQLFTENHPIYKNYMYLRRQELLIQFVLNQTVSSIRKAPWESANMHKICKMNWEEFSSDMQQRLKDNFEILKDLDPVLKTGII